MDTAASQLKAGVRGRIAKAMTKGHIPRSITVTEQEAEAYRDSGGLFHMEGITTHLVDAAYYVRLVVRKRK